MTLADAFLLILSVFAGFLLVTVGIMLLLSSRTGGGGARGVGVVLIGPVPIVLRGTGARVVVIMATLFLLVILLFLLLSGVMTAGW
ncbi:MAG: hypothetical protein QXQ48_06310 [Nitrososphaerota archaeon]